MTAPLKHSDPITVDVALGERAYDIVIGRDVLQSLGARVAALRPGARTAIVTDRNVAKHWLSRPRPRCRRPALPRRASLSTRARARKAMPASNRSARR
jgi:3-dehydroquinate synthase